MNDLFDNTQDQLDRIEAKLDLLLAPKKKPASKPKVTLDDNYFAEIWASYPKRAGSNPKQRAISAFHARCRGTKQEAERIINGVARYAKFCEAPGKTGTELVMQAATFFGPDKHYENDWTCPIKDVAQKLPRDDNQLNHFASKRDLRQARAGESYSEYRQYLEGEIR